MTCPKPEVLSQWADGSLDPRESAAVARHAEACTACRRKAEDLRAVGAWIATAGEPGPSCLSIDDMAAVLDGDRVPSHVRTCPRCATEFRSLRSAERKATRRRQKATVPMTAWAAAAAVLVVAAGVLVFVLNQGSDPATVPPPVAKTEPKSNPVEPAPAPVVPAPVVPVPPAPAPEPKPLPKEDPLKVPPPVEVPAPPVPPPSEDPKPAVPPVMPPGPARPTLVETARAIASLNVRAGSLASLADGKWVKPARLEEGVALRAEGRTQLDFAQARITLDGSSRFTLTRDDLALTEGAMSAEISVGSKFAVVLDEIRIVPQTSAGRVMLAARPDRFVVEEGSAKVKDAVLHEGVEHLVKKDRIEAQKRRSLPAAVRSRETLTWRMDVSNASAVRKNVIQGHVPKDSGMLVSDELAGSPFFHGQASYYNGGEEQPLFTVKANTAIRFRYYLTQPGVLELVMKNATKDENFNKPLEPVVKQWTTVTLYARDVPANRGGKNVTCDVGDKYTLIGWFVGKPGMPAEVYIDRLEILEIDR